MCWFWARARRVLRQVRLLRLQRHQALALPPRSPEHGHFGKFAHEINNNWKLPANDNCQLHRDGRAVSWSYRMIWCARHPVDPLATANASAFCAPRDPTGWLAVLGVFSTAHGHRARQAIRASWFATTAGILPRFVLRGLGVRPDLLAEAARHADTVFVAARSRLTCKKGPLIKLTLWLSCALEAWPSTQLIGKADDDVCKGPALMMTPQGRALP